MPEITNTSAIHIDEDIDAFAEERPAAISVDHVSMVFNMASEQLNNLKEYFLKIVKRQLFFEEFVALDDISFEVKKGDVFGILGTNGSGKSTLLKIIAGVLEPTRGSVEINGSIAPLIELGAGFDMDLSARENIYLNGALLGYSKDFIDSHFEDIVEFAEVEKFLDMPMKNYSSGMVARIAFAIATVIVPDILIVDEVLSVGDFMFQQKCEDRISELIEKHGVTVLIVSHSNEQIERLCSKAIWIEKGHPRVLGDAARVTGLYRVLGGREGSQRSEKVVLEAFERCLENGGTQGAALRAVKGSTSIQLNLRQIDIAWKAESLDSVGLACDYTHTNAIMANGFCGALGIPVVPIGHADMDPFLLQWLMERKPKKLFLFDRGGFVQDQVIAELDGLPWDLEIMPVGTSLDMLEYSSELFSLGLSMGLWGDEVGLIRFADNMEALASAPLLYGEHIPMFFMRAEDDDLASAVQLLNGAGVSDVLLFSPELPDAQRSQLLGGGLQVHDVAVGRDYSDSCINIAQYGRDRLGASGGVIVGSKALGAWPDLLSTGSLGGKLGWPILLCDCRSLDSIAGCIEYLESNGQIEGYNISGDCSIMMSEQELLSGVLCLNDGRTL